MFLKIMSLMFLSSFPFLYTLSGDFVFDDSEAIIKNKDVYSVDWRDCFCNDFWGTNIKSNLSHKSYRPLTTLTFRLNYILSGNKLSAFTFKATNLLCHTLCCILVWLSYKVIVESSAIHKMGKKIDISYLAATLYAVHPIHAEAVCGVVGRADILSGISFFLAFLSYNKSMTSKKYIYVFFLISILFSTVAMFCKENGVTVLGFCIIYDIIINYMKSKSKSVFRSFDRMFTTRIILTLLSVALLIFGRWRVMGGIKPEFKPTDNPAAFADNIFTKVATYNYLYFLNALILIWPQWLCYDWSMGCVPLVKNVSDIRILFVLMLYVYGVLTIKTMFCKRTRSSIKRILAISSALIAMPFLPAANIFYPVGFVIAERILYIPSAGYCLLVVIGLHKVIVRYKMNKLGLILYFYLITIYGLRSWQRSYDWQTEYQLFTNGLTVCPLNAKVHYNIAKVADAKNYTNWALASYKESIRLYPEYCQAMNNLANLLKNQKKYSEAELYLRNAIKYKQDFPAAWMNLGIVLASTNRLLESETAYKTALQQRKNYPDCYYNLGNLCLEMNKTKDAVENWLQAVNLNQKHVMAWTNLIALLDNTEQLEQALQIIPKALTEVPESPSVNFGIANIYGKLSHFKEAEKYFLKAIKLFGSKVQAIHYANLGVLYHRWKKYDMAEVMYLNALKVDPNFKSAMKNLNSLQRYKQS